MLTLTFVRDDRESDAGARDGIQLPTARRRDVAREPSLLCEPGMVPTSLFPDAAGAASSMGAPDCAVFGRDGC